MNETPLPTDPLNQPAVKGIPHKRICAFVIDTVFTGVINILIISGLSEKFFGSPILLPVIFGAVYFLFRDGLFNGQSVGKRLVGLRVVGPKGEKCTFKGSLIRNILIAIPVIPVAKIVILVEAIVMILSKEGRRLGDRMAKTRVIDLRPQIRDLNFLPLTVLLITLSFGGAFFQMELAIKSAGDVILALDNYNGTNGHYPKDLYELKLKTKYLYIYTEYSHSSDNKSQYFLTVNAPGLPVFKTYSSVLKDWRMWSNAQQYQKNLLEPIEERAEKPLRHYDEARKLHEAGRPNEAIAELEKALTLKGDFVDARLALAYLLKEINELDKALAEYQKVTQLAPASFEAHYNISHIYFMQERLDESLAAYRLYLKYMPMQNEKEKAEAYDHLRYLEEEVNKAAATSETSGLENVRLLEETVEDVISEPAPLADMQPPPEPQAQKPAEAPPAEPIAPIIEVKKEPGPLLRAVQNGTLTLIEELINAGEDVNERNEDGKSVLYLAVEIGSTDIAALLLNVPSLDVHAADKQGLSPLHLAGENGDLAMVKLLLKHGADADRLDKNGQTAADHARFENHTEVYDYLKRYEN
ncbi:MAG TPA: ankyrin repeat domain-containing protein [Candidatus Omnitrophota bacterium]|nr:ankyrin repeat domain-containing protein [Candidatus Omnitrophota bacterium]